MRAIDVFGVLGRPRLGQVGMQRMTNAQWTASGKNAPKELSAVIAYKPAPLTSVLVPREPYPIRNRFDCTIDPLTGQQICRPATYPAPLPFAGPPPPVAPPAPAPAETPAKPAETPAESKGPSALAIAGGAGALGLIALLATGVIKL